MRKNTVIMMVCVVLVLAFGVGSALAQNGNPCPGEKEYQINLIGVPNVKTADMTGNNGHRIFVPLKGPANIYMTGDTDPDTEGLQCGDSFYVTDANGTDVNGATLVVPCTRLTVDSTSPGVCFDVYITPLGTPGGKADVDVVCTFDDTVALSEVTAGMCVTGTIDFSLARNSGKPVRKDITQYMRATGCFVDAEDTCVKEFNNVWIFNLEALEQYYWAYTNDGLRVAQIRFCQGTDCGSITPITTTSIPDFSGVVW